MKIVLATGIYPPEIGGPATYVRALAVELARKNINVTVITYGQQHTAEDWSVVTVSKSIIILRWISYARALRTHASDADAIIVFSSISAGVPLWLARLKKPKKILRLGGDFFWERYTDRGGMKGLREWYESKTVSQQAANWIMNALLRKFDHIVFSTEFQKKIYDEHYWGFSSVSVIENALPSGIPKNHERHDPFHLLFMGRFVGFKNLSALVQAVGALRQSSGQAPHATPLRGQCILTFVGDGPMKSRLQSLTKELQIADIIRFIDPVHGEEKQKIFMDHDLLILPSITEISPNVALEARVTGLPVLLTQETGLSQGLVAGMVVRDLSMPEKIGAAIEEVMGNYENIAAEASSSLQKRDWKVVVEEWISLLSSTR